MLGIDDPWIIIAYLLCFLSALACIIYGIKNWNKGSDKEPQEMIEESKWEESDSEIKETL